MKKLFLALLSLCSFLLTAKMSVTTLQEQFGREAPTVWAETIPGVKTKLATHEKVVALTLDACGSKNDGCDYRLLNFLLDEHIPATLFVSGQWIQRHPQDFAFLCQFPNLFAIENHGLRHRPCSVNGALAYGIPGTRNIEELFDEVEGGAQLIASYTNQKPRYYRSGTAHYDDVALKIVNQLGYEVIGFSILGDAGATFTTAQAQHAVSSATPGSIIIAHMNHPAKPAGLGIIEGIKALQKKGCRFVKLSNYPLV